MLSSAAIQKLKQTNISKDPQKTKERVEAVWKPASNKMKQAIIELAGISRATVYRIYNTGCISAKLAVPIAQTLNVDPFYLTGEADERGEFDEERLREFLTSYHYQHLLSEQPRASRKEGKRGKAAASEEKEKLTEAAAPICEAEDPSVCGAPSAQPLTEDEMIVLMKSVLLRARAGGKYAALADQLRMLLMS